MVAVESSELRKTPFGKRSLNCKDGNMHTLIVFIRGLMTFIGEFQRETVMFTLLIIEVITLLELNFCSK